MLNTYLKREKKLWHWPSATAAADACLAGVTHERAGRESQTFGRADAGRFVWIFPRVIVLIIGGHTQRCTDTSDGQILNKMQV